MKIRLRAENGWNREDLENDVYNEEEIEHLLEDDEISTEEEAFMRGYIEDS